MRAAIGAEVLLYKICSTFDSLPTLGSIGRGIELLREQFPGLGPVAVAPAQPQFGRYTASVITSGCSPARSTAWTGTR